MPKFLIGLCVLSWCYVLSVAPQPTLPQQSAPEPFTFTIGQSVWVVADETPPRYFQSILLRSLSPDGNVKEVAGVSFREPILACGSEEQVSRACSKIETIALHSPPPNRAGTDRPTLDRPLPKRPTLDPEPVAMPAWTVTPDPDIKRKVEEEFQKQKKFKIAASAEAADFILWLLVLPVPEVMMTGGGIFGSPSKNDYTLRAVLALAMPPKVYHQKRQEFQQLTVAAFGNTADAVFQKQQQVRVLMKDLPWRGIALGTGRGMTLQGGQQGISLQNLIACFHKEALKKRR